MRHKDPEPTGRITRQRPWRPPPPMRTENSNAGVRSPPRGVGTARGGGCSASTRDSKARRRAMFSRTRWLFTGQPQAIAKAETVRGNAARLLSTPALCLCERRDRRSLVARMLLVDGPRSAPLGSGIRRRVAPCDGNSGAEAAEGAAEPPLPPVTSAPQDLRDVSAVMPVPRLPARPRAAARRLAAATARCASARGRRGRRSRTA